MFEDFEVSKLPDLTWICGCCTEVRLIRACRGLTSSLVATADDTSEKEFWFIESLLSSWNLETPDQKGEFPLRLPFSEG